MAETSGASNKLITFFDDLPKKPPPSLGIERIPIAEAGQFSLPGPAVVNVIYVQHPANHNELVPFADYDERLARDRYDEALRVFTKLGAARIVAKSNSQTSKRGGASLGVSRLSLNFVAKKDTSWSLAADYSGLGAPPGDPRPLNYDDIAGLAAICEGVLRNGWEKGRIHITQSSELGVDGEIAQVLKKAGFKLGLSGGKAKVTEFVIEAAFSQDTARELDPSVEETEIGIARRVFRRRQ